jgi:co-chaperonin GroES (HSP10)
MVAIYSKLETRSPAPGWPGRHRWSVGSETHEIPSIARPCRRPPHRGRGQTKGGIIIPDTAKEKRQEGEVIAVGHGARDESGKLVPLDIKAGDRVLFGKWSGTEVKIDGRIF